MEYYTHDKQPVNNNEQVPLNPGDSALVVGMTPEEFVSGIFYNKDDSLESETNNIKKIERDEHRKFKEAEILDLYDNHPISGFRVKEVNAKEGYAVVSPDDRDPKTVSLSKLNIKVPLNNLVQAEAEHSPQEVFLPEVGSTVSILSHEEIMKIYPEGYLFELPRGVEFHVVGLVHPPEDNPDGTHLVKIIDSNGDTYTLASDILVTQKI